MGTLQSIAAVLVMLSNSNSQPPGRLEPAAKPLSLSFAESPMSKGQVSKGHVKANGITIAYESFGPADRETVLLIMGTGG
jgi:hypothetical protein